MDRFSELDDGNASNRSDAFPREDDDALGFALGRGHLALGMPFTAGYLLLLMLSPMAWAVLTAAGVVLVFGMFTARYLFDAQGWKLLWLGLPLGFCWLGIFWLVVMGVS